MRVLPWIVAAACGRPEARSEAPAYPPTPVATTGDPVAKVGPVTFTTDELSQRINRQSPFMRQRFTDLERRAQFARNEVRFELLAQEGWARGLHSDPQILMALKKAIVERLIKDESRRLLDGLDVTDAELRVGYVEDSEEYNKPERVRLSQIVRFVRDEAERKKAHALLEKLRAEVLAAEKQNDPQRFDAAAREHSEDEATRTAGGDLQFLTREELLAKYGEAVAKAAFEGLQVGDSAVADAENAVVLLKKTGLRRAVERSLEQVKPQLRAKLLQDKKTAAFEAFVKELEAKWQVKLDEAALEKIEIDLSAPTEVEP